MRARGSALALLFALGCSDFELPSALSRPQIIAVRATPASIGSGERARLDALVAGPAGVLAPALAWHLVAAPDGVVLDRDPGGTTWLHAPANATVDQIVVGLDADGLAAEKTISIGDEGRDNPIIVDLSADGSAVGDELRVSRGQTVTLDVVLDTPDPRTSWYTTLGEIELYRRTPTQLVAPHDPGIGTLVIVGRDQAAGVAWRVVRLVVE